MVVPDALSRSVPVTDSLEESDDDDKCLSGVIKDRWYVKMEQSGNGKLWNTLNRLDQT